MVNVRRGINIRVGFSVYRNGIPEDMAEAQTIRVVIRHKSLPNSSAAFTGSAVKVLGNSVSVVVSDIMQRTMAAGLYYIEVAYRLVSPTAPDGYDPYIVDADVFELVERSLDPNDIVIQTVNIPGEVSFSSQALDEILVEASGAVQAANAAAEAANDAAAAAMAIVDSKIDLDGLNSNIRQLKFNTATPVAPTQAGQMAWSDEEGTLALHNGLHTHPIGRETFFKAKNNSGALIANGKAVYAIGSTGANATIGLATTANGDIAQRTIGIATMDIASNGFGDVTTFGEVNDINTSALTEGALVYLGLNGNLTSVEPVAPTPKISLGLCIRSHLTQGRIAVYVRPIARLNKLTDVYAPNLLDGDVLRWNGTALRYEVYNLVNKADLVGGKVPASQLPAYVDDILEYATFVAFPAVGETGKLYVTLDTNLTYRWSGSAYTEVSKSLAIGITSTTAFRGDWGKIAYDHSQLTNSNPHGTTAAQIANTPAGTIAATTVQAAINELDADRVQLETNLNLKINKTSVKQVTGTSETDVMSQKAVTDELAKKQDTNLLASYTHSGNKEVYISSIDYTTNTFTSVGHGLINSATLYNTLMLAINRNETIYPYNVMPFNSADLTVNGLFVINATADTFQLSTTAGGAAITLINKAENDLTKWHFEYTTVKTITISGLLGKINAGVKTVIDGTIIWGYAQYIGAQSAGLAYIKSSDGATPSFNYPVIYGQNDYPLPCFGGQIIQTDIYTNNGHRKIFDIAVYGYGTALNKVAMTNKYINFVTPTVIADSYKSFVLLDGVSISNGTTIKVYSL